MLVHFDFRQHRGSKAENIIAKRKRYIYCKRLGIEEVWNYIAIRILSETDTHTDDVLVIGTDNSRLVRADDLGQFVELRWIGWCSIKGDGQRRRWADFAVLLRDERKAIGAIAYCKSMAPASRCGIAAGGGT